MKKIVVALAAVGAVVLTGCAPMSGHGSLDSTVSGSAQIEFHSKCSKAGNLVGSLEFQDRAAGVSLEGKVRDADYTTFDWPVGSGDCSTTPVDLAQFNGEPVSALAVPFTLKHCRTDCTGIALVGAVDGGRTHHNHAGRTAPGCDAMVPGVDYVIVALQGSSKSGYVNCGPLRRGGVEISVDAPQ